MLVLVGKESAIFRQFHDHVDYIIFDEGVPKLDDMRVIDIRMQIYLPLQKQELIFRNGRADVNLGWRKKYHFDSEAFVGGYVEGQFNSAKGADSDFFDEAKLADRGKEPVGLDAQAHRNSN